MSAKSEALRMADRLEGRWALHPEMQEITAELRRLAKAEAQRGALLEALATAKQALAEMHHAHFSPNWFTNGQQGATQQFLLWHGKASAAIKAVEEGK